MADYLALPRDPKKAAELTNASVENSISCNKHRFVLCEQTSPLLLFFRIAFFINMFGPEGKRERETTACRARSQNPSAIDYRVSAHENCLSLSPLKQPGGHINAPNVREILKRPSPQMVHYHSFTPILTPCGLNFFSTYLRTC